MSLLRSQLQDEKFHGLVSAVRDSLDMHVDNSRWMSFLAAVEQGSVAVREYDSIHAHDDEWSDDAYPYNGDIFIDA